MKICQKHWDMCRAAVADRGLGDLVAKSGSEAANDAMAELRGEESKFDPLMSMHWHWTNEALRCGGLYLMSKNETGENDGEYCPICEFEKHASGFVANDAIGMVADQMQVHARSEGLIPIKQ